MQQRFWLILAGIAFVALGAYYVLKSPPTLNNEFLSTPWVEIISPGVSVLKENGALQVINT